MLELTKLNNCTCKELSELCKGRNLKHYRGKNRFTKQEMIDLLVESEKQTSKEKAVESVKEPKKPDYEGKKRYINSLTKGVIVAFQEKKDKLNTAAVKSIVRDKQGNIVLIHLETQYKKLFHITPDKILWVKTNGRFPKDIYLQLKGLKGKGAKNGKEKVKNER